VHGAPAGSFSQPARVAYGRRDDGAAFQQEARLTTMAATMAITADQVKRLREKTGAGMMECKAALQEAEGNEEKAVELLRKKGLASAAKRAGRATANGVVGSYIHMGGKVGVLVEVNCETDFVARTEDFQTLVKELALHIAAADPKFVRREDVPADLLEKEKEIYRAQFAGSGKPANVVEKIVEGKLGAFYSQIVLVDQPSVRDQAVSISQMIAQASAKTGENITVGRFARFKVGESAE
jgi:elongation factor Ts